MSSGLYGIGYSIQVPGYMVQGTYYTKYTVWGARDTGLQGARGTGGARYQGVQQRRDTGTQGHKGTGYRAQGYRGTGIRGTGHKGGEVQEYGVQAQRKTGVGSNSGATSRGGIGTDMG